MELLKYLSIDEWYDTKQRGTSQHYAEYAIITVLIHRTLDKMAAISQTMFSDALSWMKRFVFRLKFHRISLIMVQLIITQHWFR